MRIQQNLPRKDHIYPVLTKLEGMLDMKYLNGQLWYYFCESSIFLHPQSSWDKLYELFFLRKS